MSIVRDSIQIVWSLLDSPLVWFGLLLTALIGAGVLAHLAVREAQKPHPMFSQQSKPMTDREKRYHSSNQIGR